MPLHYSSPRRQLQAMVARAYGSQGDPFLGSLIRGAFTVGKALVKKFAKPKLLPAGFPGGVVGPAIGGAAGGAIINQFPVREVFRRGGELLGMDTRGGGQCCWLSYSQSHRRSSASKDYSNRPKNGTPATKNQRPQR